MYGPHHNDAIRACAEALKTFGQGSSAVDAVETAICVLEDEECLNAGKSFKVHCHHELTDLQGMGRI